MYVRTDDGRLGIGLAPLTMSAAELKSVENYLNDPISVRKISHNDPIWTNSELVVRYIMVDHNPRLQVNIFKHVRKKCGKLPK